MSVNDQFTDSANSLVAALERAVAHDRLPAAMLEHTAKISSEKPRDPTHGDVASNLAMMLAKPFGLKPRDVADILADELRKDADVREVSVAGPGFVNISYVAAYWAQKLRSIVTLGAKFGHSEPRLDPKTGEQISVLIEYVSANPTGPVNIAAARGAAVGDALASIFAANGYKVAREYYVNDAGAQIDRLADTCWKRYLTALGEHAEPIAPDSYPGEYLIPVGEELARKYGASLLSMAHDERQQLVSEFVVASMIKLIREDLALFNVHQDRFFFEKSLTQGSPSHLQQTHDKLVVAGMVYTGELARPRGSGQGGPAQNWQPVQLKLFRSSAYGDDQDRALAKADNSPTYFAFDAAYHDNKLQRASWLINVVGADHGGYVARLNAVVACLSDQTARLDVVQCQTVRMIRDGVPVKMSKRAGDYITLREVIDEVGSGPVRLVMLSRSHDTNLDFDLTALVDKSRDNPVFYLQYAYARTKSLLAAAKDVLAPAVDNGASAVDSRLLDVVEDPVAKELVMLLASYPRVLQQAAQNLEPHRVVNYLMTLSAAFHRLWSQGNDDPSKRFLVEDKQVSRARLVVVEAITQVIGNGLEILGVDPMEKM